MLRIGLDQMNVVMLAAVFPPFFNPGLDSWKAENSDVFLGWDGDVIFVDQNEQEVTAFGAPGRTAPC